jgi:enoyl-[acyl-carrier protein] reductase/trans-2-enoyl-CoA reductase (NAD+)
LTGFGLASRISSAFDQMRYCIFENRLQQEEQLHQVGTICCFEKEAQKRVYMQKCQRRCLSDEIKKETLALIKADLGQVDLIIA